MTQAEAQTPTLTQEQIDRVVEAVRSGKLSRPAESLSAATRARSIDFRDRGWSQDRILRRHLPVLDLVFDRIAPAIQVTLTKSLRFPVRAAPLGVELQQFGDFMDRFDGSSLLLEVMRLDPLRGINVIAMEPVVVYALIDALMGGLGIPDVPGDRDISDVEMSLLYRVYADILRDLENAWRPWFPLSVDHVRTDRNSKYLTTLPREEVCHIASLEVTGDVLPPSRIYFVFPYGNLEPLHEAISARSGEEMDPNWKANLQTHIRETEASVSVVVGETMLSASRISNLSVGDLIHLAAKTSDDVTVRVEQEPIFTGSMGRSGLRYGVKITGRRQGTERIVDRSAGQLLVRKGLISREQLVVAQIDEFLNKRPALDSVVARGWLDRKIMEQALSS